MTIVEVTDIAQRVGCLRRGCSCLVLVVDSIGEFYDAWGGEGDEAAVVEAVVVEQSGDGHLLLGHERWR